MPDFLETFDTSGGIYYKDMFIIWDSLSDFVQGYFHAMFYTDSGPEDGQLGEVNFCDLAPEALAKAIYDCDNFLDTDAWRRACDAEGLPDVGTAGRDFWYTRNGHGCGFPDGDWPEPYATSLTAAAQAFGETWTTLGEDGKVYLS